MMKEYLKRQNASTGAGHGNKVAGEAGQRLIYVSGSRATPERVSDQACIANDKLDGED